MRANADITHAVETHANTVLRVCSLYFRSEPDRDDALQETFIKYAQSDKEFADDEHVKAWLITVASNTCKDMLKAASSKVLLVDEIDETASPHWSQSHQQGNCAEELIEALHQLDDKHRIPLYLKYYEGYSAVEIAQMLGIPENTVYTNLSRGRNKLKEVLTHDQDAKRRIRRRQHERRRAV